MISKSSKLTKAILGVALVAGLAGCVSTGAAVNPIERKFQWLSYLEGADFRDACGPESPAQYRMVYNGVYTEQLRAYDLDGAGALRVEIIRGEDVSEIEVSAPADLLNPWRGKVVNFKLDDTDMGKIVNALDQNGMFGPPTVGLELSSKGFFWTIAACHDGQYHFTAVTWPSAAWEALTFNTALMDVDLSQVPVNPPRKTDLRRDLSGDGRHHASDIEFHSKVGPRGLVKLSDLFQ